MRPVEKNSDRTYEGKRSPRTRQQVSRILYAKGASYDTFYVSWNTRHNVNMRTAYPTSVDHCGDCLDNERRILSGRTYLHAENAVTVSNFAETSQ